MAFIKDNRDESQMDTHTVLIAGNDKFGTSWTREKQIACWACRPEDDYDGMMEAIKSRTDMTHVRFTSLKSLKRSGAKITIYVAKPERVGPNYFYGYQSGMSHLF